MPRNGADMYTTASGVPIPQGTDSFSPPTQYKNWADKAATYENRVVVASDSARNALAAPVRRDGLRCYVTGTDTEYIYDGTTWVAVVEDTDWVTATPGSNWAVTSAVRYRRKNGVVFLRGIVSRTTGSDNIITLPPGFQPSVNAVHPIGTTAPSSVRATVTNGGIVQQTPLVSGQFMYLDGISFIAEQ